MSIYLPFDILTAIFEEIDDVRDLWHIRTASRTFCAAATPFAFHVLSMIATKGSAQNLGQLFDVPDIADHVREITFRDTDIDRRGRTINHGASFPPSPHVINITICLCAPAVAGHLPRLETINLTYYPRYANQLPWENLAFQSSILSALVSSFRVCVPNLKSLSLYNLHTSDHSPLESPSFQTVLTTLQRFELSPLFDTLHPLIVDDSWSHFWGTIRPRVLTPMQHCLTELTLHSNVHVGTLVGLSFDRLHFPHLYALSLGRVIFDTSVGAQDFTLRHAPAITQLGLRMCRLPISPGSPSPIPPMALVQNESGFGPDSWECIWDCFAEKLTALVSLRV
ncbi:hypothetical protein EDB92DRAFT_1957813 [Lactarius akahatsu]|uniref:F-box domain-containing protein n=1 Tax=Lactarius akahatsu TaxID=416441 RepID=A0AAD4L4I6_9AGAM|nr:hypothetical protein EDB92DRAFT_1957813 [Lactarius akahatsu]